MKLGAAVSLRATAIAPSPVDQIAAFTYKWNLTEGTTGPGFTPVRIHRAPATDNVSVTTTDENGESSVTALSSIIISAVATAGPTVAITPGWLQQQGPGPYVLAHANTTYVLNTDVTTTGTAFVVLAPNITLNLDGHTVTYGNSAPLTVNNGGFESGSGTTVPGWNMTGASTAALAPNTNYLFGDQVLRLTNFSTAQTIISDPIPIRLINHTYKATITPGNVNVADGTSVTISVIDTVTGLVLATGSSANTQRGFSAIAAFTPTTTDPLKLQVVVTPASGVTTSVDLDAATLNVSYDYGIIASAVFSGDMPGSGAGILNQPITLQNTYNSTRVKMLNGANFTVENGSIIQGQGNGTNSSPLFFQYLGGFTVNNMTSSDTGIDTTNLDAYGASGKTTITNSTFRDNIPNITNRMSATATVLFSNTTGNIVIMGNRVLGSPQFGVGVSNNNRHSLVIKDNYISQNSIVANAYGIGLVAVSNFQINGNRIVPQCGAGVDVDGYSAAGSNNGAIQNNHVEAQERSNRETGNNTYARALRLRNNVDSMGPHTNIDISGNTFITRDGPGYSKNAYTVWISYVNNKGAMNNANVNLHDNTIEAIVNTTDPTYHAYALDLDHMDAGINMTISNNVLKSNDTSLAIGGYNDGNVNGVTFIGNTLDISSARPARRHTGILAGFDITQIHKRAHSRHWTEKRRQAKITWAGSGTKNIHIGTTIKIRVQNPNGMVASGATVQIFGRAKNLVYKGTTNEHGNLWNIPLLTTTHTQAGIDPTVITSTITEPFTMVVTNGNKSATLIVNPSKNLEYFALLSD